MNFREVDLQQVRFHFPLSGERILYAEKDFVINIPEEVQFSAHKLYRSVERIVTDEGGNFCTKKALEETGELVATANVSGPFYYFFLELYSHIEKQLHEYDRWEGNTFDTPLQHLLGKSVKERNLLYLKVDSTEKKPIAFCIHSLDLSRPEARFVLQVHY